METVLGICFYRKSMFFFCSLLEIRLCVTFIPSFLSFLLLMIVMIIWAICQWSSKSLLIVYMLLYIFYDHYHTHTHTWTYRSNKYVIVWKLILTSVSHLHNFLRFSLLFVAFFFGYELDFHNNGMSCPSCCSSGRTYPSCFDSIREKEKKNDQTMTPLSSNELNHSNNNFFFFLSQKDSSCEIMTST